MTFVSLAATSTLFSPHPKITVSSAYIRTSQSWHTDGKSVLGASVVQEVKKSFSKQKVASSIPCRSVLKQDTEPLIAPYVQCAISVNVKCVYILSRTYVSRFG